MKKKTETVKKSSRRTSDAARQKGKLTRTEKAESNNFQEQTPDAPLLREETPAQEEARKWASLAPTATAAFNFWKDFLVLRMGAANNQALDDAATLKFMTIVRAVSWVESRHGTGTGSSPDRDPMQCGNPDDSWWKSLNAAPGSPVDRFVRGPGATPNYDANKLPEAMETNAAFPANAKLSHLTRKTDGHRDARFNSSTSFFWGVPFLIHKINTNDTVTNPDPRTYKCGDCSKSRMINGADAYNGGGDPSYKTKIEAAWNLIGGPSILGNKIEFSNEIEFSSDVFEMTVADVNEEWIKTALEITGDFETQGDPWKQVTSNDDGQGISCGILQWCIGQDSLQPKVRACGRETVRRLMSVYGEQFWEACTKPKAEGMRIVVGWQIKQGSRYSIKAPILKELQNFCASPEMVQQQVDSVRAVGRTAFDSARKWARDSRNANEPTLREFCWFYDIYTQNGGMKGLWVDDVKRFVANHSPGKADDAVCNEILNFPTYPGYEGHQRDLRKNVEMWRDNVSPAYLDLFVLSYLRTLKSRREYWNVVMNRKGAIALTRGYVNGSLESFEKLRRENFKLVVLEIESPANLVVKGIVKNIEIRENDGNFRCFAVIELIAELAGETVVSTSSLHFQSLLETAFLSRLPVALEFIKEQGELEIVRISLGNIEFEESSAGNS